MTDFVIVIAAAAALATPAPMPAPSATSNSPVAAATVVPQNAPTVGFRTYGDLASCERATSGLVAPAGMRLVCLPVEPIIGEMASAY
jgi:hypothetical protein